MSITTLLAISACGGFGAIARFVVDTLIKRVKATIFPWSTLIINTTAGLLFAAALAFLHQDNHIGLYALATTGFLGGFSTFSTAMNEIISLARAKHWVDFAIYLLLAVGLPVLAIIGGLMFFVALRG
ncbi:fluoride efflux transporter FluC [Alloscardovia criceti]|uniref:fluoride efflux transporter FluC n=1 Tax=Alloscardovia criceti TaxID=356828 RepID=UPI00037A3496|nr:CrcB family protein [Alloscardovia criceti]